MKAVFQVQHCLDAVLILFPLSWLFMFVSFMVLSSAMAAAAIISRAKFVSLHPSSRNSFLSLSTLKPAKMSATHEKNLTTWC